jgi:hypothetical protein
MKLSVTDTRATRGAVQLRPPHRIAEQCDANSVRPAMRDRRQAFQTEVERLGTRSDKTENSAHGYFLNTIEIRRR